MRAAPRVFLPAKEVEPARPPTPVPRIAYAIVQVLVPLRFPRVEVSMNGRPSKPFE